MSYMLVDVANILFDTKHSKHIKSQNVITGGMLEPSTTQFAAGKSKNMSEERTSPCHHAGTGQSQDQKHGTQWLRTGDTASGNLD